MSGAWVALSGGVDSAVAAARVIASGEDVVGVTLRMMPPGRQSSHDEAIDLAAKIAGHLQIPHRVIDVSTEFSSRVLDYVADSYVAGLTPNPCVRCNEEIKFATLLSHAAEDGARAVITGHYARIAQVDGVARIRRASDPAKDQSYFLYRLSPSVLEKVRFPLGDSLKDSVKAEAGSLGLSWLVERGESQDVCFATDEHFLEEVRRRRPDAARPGEIVDSCGNVVGRHQGVAGYTIGQRKGLGIGGEGPYYVTGIDPGSARVTVGSHDDLLVSRIEAARPVWQRPPEAPYSCLAQTRYRSEPVPAQAVLVGDRLEVSLENSVKGAALGQSVVCYEGDTVLGGGEIWASS